MVFPIPFYQMYGFAAMTRMSARSAAKYAVFVLLLVANACRLDQLAPLGHIGSYQCRELLSRIADRFNPGAEKPFFRLRPSEHLHDFLVQPVDDCCRRV